MNETRQPEDKQKTDFLANTRNSLKYDSLIASKEDIAQAVI